MKKWKTMLEFAAKEKVVFQVCCEEGGCGLLVVMCGTTNVVKEFPTYDAFKRWCRKLDKSRAFASSESAGALYQPADVDDEDGSEQIYWGSYMLELDYGLVISLFPADEADIFEYESKLW